MQQIAGIQPYSIQQVAQPPFPPISDFSQTAEAGLSNFKPLANLPPILFLENENTWVLTRHEDIKALLKDDRFKRLHQPVTPRGAPDKLKALLDRSERQAAKAWMQEPDILSLFAEHIRTAAHKATRRKLANIATHKKLDSGCQYAYGVAHRTVAELFGIPEKNLSVFIRFARAYIDIKNSRKDLSNEEIFHAYENLDIGLALIDASDFTPLAQLAQNAGIPNHEFVLDTLLTLLLEGLDLCTQLVAGGIYLCNRYENERRKLIESGSWEKLPTEVYRYFSPVNQTVLHVATRSCSLNGHAFKKGAQIYPLIAAANRDSDVFSSPSIFEVDRNNSEVIFYDTDGSAIGCHFALVAAEVALQHYFERQLLNHPSI